MSITFVFFFQAEDGIRDYKVTGVQTCALPISETVGAGAAAADEGSEKTPRGLTVRRVFTTEGVHPYDQVRWEQRDVVMTNWRSEERRVGKECRSRWSPDH